MRRWRLVASIALAAALLAYLYDPPWIGGVTSGMRAWEEDPHGVRFRWTAGRASFYVPSAAAEMTLPMRGAFPSGGPTPVVVNVSADDRWLADIQLDDPQQWKRVTLPLPQRQTHRRYRRLELRVSRTVGPFNLGVQVGEPVTR